MVKIRISDDEVTMTGDFFMHPEDSITELEKVIQNNLHKDPQTLKETLENFFEDKNVELLGASPDDIAETVVDAR